MDNEKTFDKLPVEVISHIFTYLQFSEKKLVSTVCSSWYEASIHPMFLKNEVICLKNLSNYRIRHILTIFSKSVRAFFKFRIYGFGISYPYDLETNNDDNKDDFEDPVNQYHWVKTIWPLLAAKIFSLEFFDTVGFVKGMLCAILNETQQLKVLFIENRHFSIRNDLYGIKRLNSLEELTLIDFLTDNIYQNKLLRIISNRLKKLSLISVRGNKMIDEDIINVLRYCSSYLKHFDLIDVKVTPELMQSISSIDLKLEGFTLALPNATFYKNTPEVYMPLVKAKWPLFDLTLFADCMTDEDANILLDSFKELKQVSINFKLFNVTQRNTTSKNKINVYNRIL